MNKSSDKSGINDQKKLKEAFDTLIKAYLENANANGNVEVEFGVNPDSPTITKIEFDQLIIDLYSYGFTIENKEGNQILYIYPEIRDDDNTNKQSYIKIYGVDYIQQYCKSDSFMTLKRIGVAGTESVPSNCPTNNLKLKNKLKSIRSFKSTMLNELTDTDKGKCVIPFMDFNFQVLYKEEETVDINDSSIDVHLSNWKTTKKFFRHVNRIRMIHNDFPLSVDLSILKTSAFGRSGKPILTTTLLDSNLFKSMETYNIKIKLNNERIFNAETPEKGSDVIAILRKTIRFILCTLQDTNYPISQIEHKELQHQYLKLVLQKYYKPTINRVKSDAFIGPSSFTLLIDNIMELDEIGEESCGMPNIRKNYAVTDKADGERRLIFITDKGFVYLINTNMQFSFTGLKTVNKDLFGSLIDGEYIRVDKFGKSVSMFFAFDIYFMGAHDVRKLPFYEHPDSITASTTNTKDRNRYKLLRNFIAELNVIPKEKTMSCNMKIEVKLFLFSEPDNPNSIFQKSKEMLALVNNEDSYQYNRDGVIFTPYDLGVGQNTTTDPIMNRKIAWTRSLKWKPPQYNTIDFYVTIKKGERNVDLITTEYTESGDTITYKTLILRCGFNEDTDGYVDPFGDMIDGKTFKTSTTSYEDNYKPYPFIPISPIDLNAQYANMLIKGDAPFKTEDGDQFNENMIVEFKYNLDNPPLWRWIPIRVRYDKTYKLKQGQKEYGNSFKTANSIWKSIHFPITEEMISTGGDTIPKILDDQMDSYYNRKVKTLDTKPLRDFHNLYVKSGLIMGVSQILTYKSNLIDFTVGKAGDLPKWIKGKFGFVFGIDIDQNNIKNRRDGACARYLNNKRTNIPHLPQAFFLVGDVTQPLMSGEGEITASAFADPNDRKIAQIIFGDEKVSLKDNHLGNGVLKLHNRAKGGFQLGSCQFSLHYFFESKEKIHGFLQNVTETITKDGYFIATCYDGKTVFDMLNDKEIEYEETFTLRKDNKRIFEITRMYKETGFPDNDLSIGYAIDIYQESINNTIREYLVNPTYFIQLMEEYGFILCPTDDLVKMKLISGTGKFSELFAEMEKTNKLNPKLVNSEYKMAIYMSPEEKMISFLNRYYIFKKVRDVSVADIHKLHLKSPLNISHPPLTKEVKVLRRLNGVKKYTIDPKKVDFI